MNLHKLLFLWETITHWKLFCSLEISIWTERRTQRHTHVQMETYYAMKVEPQITICLGDVGKTGSPIWEKIFKQNFKKTMSISLYQLDSFLRKMEKGVHWSIVYAAGELEVMWVAITDKVNRLEVIDYTYNIRIRTDLQNIVPNDKRQNAILLM